MGVLAMTLLLTLTLAGCTSMGGAPKADTISFDRASFAFLVADVNEILRRQCKEKKLDTVTCARIDEQYKELRRQIMTPPATTPSGIDAEQMMKLLGVLIGAAT